MKRVIGTLVGIAAVGLIAAAAFAYSGIYNVGADDPHWPITYKIMQLTRSRGIEAHARSLTPPADLTSTHRIVAGAVHFATHCATCHSAPGTDADDLAEGMYPKPPKLTDASQRWSAPELFWIVKHGIKMSGMPSWADHGDDQLWNVVAFLEKLPSLNSSSYDALIAEAKRDGIGHDMGEMKPTDGGMNNMNMMGHDRSSH